MLHMKILHNLNMKILHNLNQLLDNAVPISQRSNECAILTP